jgi:hypothetical protein
MLCDSLNTRDAMAKDILRLVLEHYRETGGSRLLPDLTLALMAFALVQAFW